MQIMTDEFVGVLLENRNWNKEISGGGHPNRHYISNARDITEERLAVFPPGFSVSDGSALAVQNSINLIQQLCIHSLWDHDRAAPSLSAQGDDADKPRLPLMVGSDGRIVANANDLPGIVHFFKNVHKRVSPVVQAGDRKHRDEFPSLVFVRTVTDPEHVADGTSVNARLFALSSRSPTKVPDEECRAAYVEAVMLDAILEGLVLCGRPHPDRPYKNWLTIHSGATDDNSPDAAVNGIYQVNRLIRYGDDAAGIGN